MGDLRLNKGVKCGCGDIWVRAYGSQHNVSRRVMGSSYRQYIYGADFGADRGWQADASNRVYTGLFAGYGGDRKDYRMSGTKGDTDSFYFGAYGTWINDNGWYADLVVKGQYFDHDFRSWDDSFYKTTGDYNQWAVGTSLEFGKLIQLENRWYLEPQVQFSYFHAEGVGYNTEGANRFHVDLAGSDVLNIRYGLNAGRQFVLRDNGILQPYVKVEGMHQMSRGGHVRDGEDRWRANMDGATVRTGAGIIWQWDDRNHLHVEYEAAFGNKYKMPWSVNAGYRYQF